MTIDLRARGVEIILLDIEGTTTPVGFVTDVLFPYARSHVRAYVAEHLGLGALEGIERSLAQEWTMDTAHDKLPRTWRRESLDVRRNSIVDYAEWLMDRDRKSPALKALQGLIWEGGYRSGVLRGDVFPDVPRALTRWRALGIETAIYSSGSVLAQRLLFENTSHGDLTPTMTAFFDTAVGAKGEQSSYDLIAATLDSDPARMLFVSDAITELAAARAIGMQVALCVRPGNAEVAGAHAFETVTSFDDLVG